MEKKKSFLTDSGNRGVARSIRRQKQLHPETSDSAWHFQQAKLGRVRTIIGLTEYYFDTYSIIGI